MDSILRLIVDADVAEAVLARGRLSPYRVDPLVATARQKIGLHIDTCVVGTATEASSRYADIVSFLDKHRDDLGQLVAASHDPQPVLDIALLIDHGMATTSLLLPPALMRIAADLGFSIQVSAYLSSDT